MQSKAGVRERASFCLTETRSSQMDFFNDFPHFCFVLMFAKSTVSFFQPGMSFKEEYVNPPFLGSGERSPGPAVVR